MTQRGPSGPGKYVLRMSIDIEVSDPLQLAIQNLTMNSGSGPVAGADDLASLITERFIAWHRLLNGQDLGFQVGGGITDLLTEEEYLDSFEEPERTWLRKQRGIEY